jgi:hypothetical protein
MAKLKTLLIFGGVVLFFAVVIYIMNLPIFSSKNITMDKYNAADLAKTDFDKGTVRFIEISREEPKEKGSNTPPSSKWVIPAEKEIGKAVLDKYCKKIRIEPDYSKEEKAFNKEEYNFAVAYNRTMLKLVLANDKTLIVNNPPQPVKTAVEKPAPPPPMIIDDGNIPMEKVKPPVLAKTDFERSKVRFIDVFREDSKKPGTGTWVVPLEKDIGKDLLAQYPDRIRIEKNADVDPKVFQKNEAGYASSYNRSMLKFINPDAPIFKTLAKKPAETTKISPEKKPEELTSPAQSEPTEKPAEPNKPEMPSDPNGA